MVVFLHYCHFPIFAFTTLRHYLLLIAFCFSFVVVGGDFFFGGCKCSLQPSTEKGVDTLACRRQQSASPQVPAFLGAGSALYPGPCGWVGWGHRQVWGQCAGTGFFFSSLLVSGRSICFIDFFCRSQQAVASSSSLHFPVRWCGYFLSFYFQAFHFIFINVLQCAPLSSTVGCWFEHDTSFSQV